MRSDYDDIELSQRSRHAFGIEQPDAIGTQSASELALGQRRRYLIENGKRCRAHLRGCTLQGVQGFYSAS